MNYNVYSAQFIITFLTITILLLRGIIITKRINKGVNNEY